MSYKPENCLFCKYYKATFSPKYPERRTVWLDWCTYLGVPFAKLNIILRGEKRPLTLHDQDDLRKNYPMECPYYNYFRQFWESGRSMTMTLSYFIYEMEEHGDLYRGWTVYSLKENIEDVRAAVPAYYQLHYMTVSTDDFEWFVSNFNETTLLLNPERP